VDGYVTICPVQWYKEMQVVFSAAKHYNNGFLPNAGGWADQPAKLMEFIKIANAEKAKHGNE